MDYQLFDYEAAKAKHEHDVAVLASHLGRGATVWGGGASVRKSSGESYLVTYVSPDHDEVGRYFTSAKQAVRFYLRRADVLGCTVEYPAVQA